jgi:hypothetical protein
MGTSRTPITPVAPAIPAGCDLTDRHGQPLDRVGDELERSPKSIDLAPIVDERCEPVEVLSRLLDAGEGGAKRELDGVAGIVERVSVHGTSRWGREGELHECDSCG